MYVNKPGGSRHLTWQTFIITHDRRMKLRRGEEKQTDVLPRSKMHFGINIRLVKRCHFLPGTMLNVKDAVQATASRTLGLLQCEAEDFEGAVFRITDVG